MTGKTRRKRVLIFGAGIIGGQVCDLLSRMNDRFSITLSARTQGPLNERANLAITSAMCLGHDPQITTAPCDVFETDACASLIAATAPDFVVNATSLQTFWQISKLPSEVYKTLAEARVGPWLPNHLATARAVMRAVKQSGTTMPVVNAAFPDAVNPALATIGLAPTVGGGNIANIVPTLTRAAAKQLGVDRQTLKLRFVAHHVACNAISSFGSPGDAPTGLSVLLDGADVTSELDQQALFASVTGEFKRVRGVTGQIVAASGVAAVTAALADDDNEHAMHVPGPNALPGGYPAIVGKGSVRLALPNSIPHDDALRINLEGQDAEGISEIRPDGTVVYREREMSVLRDAFGYECKEMHVNDVEDWAADLQARYRAFADRAAA